LTADWSTHASVTGLVDFFVSTNPVDESFEPLLRNNPRRAGLMALYPANSSAPLKCMR
jgi:hypothetical protein